MNKSEESVLSNWYRHHENIMRCDCVDCKKLYDEALARLLELGKRANKASTRRLAGGRSKRTSKAASRR